MTPEPGQLWRSKSTQMLRVVVYLVDDNVLLRAYDDTRHRAAGRRHRVTIEALRKSYTFEGVTKCDLKS